MGLSEPWAESPEIIVFQTVRILTGFNPMVLSTPRSDSLDIIAFQKVKNARYEPNVPLCP